jgi:ABC-type branched-subunit amino acid transport system ATPase component
VTAEPAAGPLLEVRDLTVHHGQLRALTEVSLAVWPGEVYAMIGANGAGKSTLLRTIAGQAPDIRHGHAGRRRRDQAAARPARGSRAIAGP